MRKKKLLYRRAQSRFRIQLNAPDGAVFDMSGDESKDGDQKTKDSSSTSTSTKATQDDAKTTGTDGDDDNEDNISVLSTPVAVSLSEEEEEKLEKLEAEFLKADPDYYGFVKYERFTKCLTNAGFDLDELQKDVFVEVLCGF